MSVENNKVCCNCRHNIRTGELGNIQCHCDIDNQYIGYVQCMEYWCRHWSKEKRNIWSFGEDIGAKERREEDNDP